jgi:type II secretory pathway pseudopilin PulG
LCQTTISPKKAKIVILCRAPQKPINRHRGFALALVLVVVALIGLIMAVLSRGTTSVSRVEDRDEARLQGSALITSVQTLQTQLSTNLASNGTKGYQLWAARGGTTVRTSIYNLYRPEGGVTPPKFDERFYDSVAGVNPCANQSSTNKNNSDTDSNGCMWYITRVNFKLGSNLVDAVPNGSAMTNEIYVYTTPLKASICGQINNLLYQSLLSDTTPSCAGAGLLTKLAPPLSLTYSGTQKWSSIVDLTANASAPQPGIVVPETVYDAGTPCTLPTINGAPRTEFCVRDSANNYQYGKIVLIQ